MRAPGDFIQQLGFRGFSPVVLRHRGRPPHTIEDCWQYGHARVAWRDEGDAGFWVVYAFTSERCLAVAYEVEFTIGAPDAVVLATIDAVLEAV